MKIILAVFSLCLLMLCASCQKTDKMENKSKNPDTIVIKKDSMIRKTDTTGFDKK